MSNAADGVQRVLGARVSAAGTDSVDRPGHPALPDSPAGQRVAPVAGAPPGNTAPANDIGGETGHVLRWGVDSLYLSYPGDLSSSWDQRLQGLKAAAQGQEPGERSRAQVSIGGHLFEVRDRGRSRFPYVVSDNWFDVALSGAGAQRLPLAYAQVSSELLTAVGPEEAERVLRVVVGTFGTVSDEVRVSRADLFVDFTSPVAMDSWRPLAWVSRADDVASYTQRGRFSGWAIGAGGQLGARLYDKTLEIEKSHKDYLLPLWRDAGWDGVSPVWRLEFQLRREVLGQLGVPGLPALLGKLGGAWAYLTDDWLRLTVPSEADSRRARWPIHPLWTLLSSVPWSTLPEPSLSRVRRERVPRDEYLAVHGVAGLTSFMASRGITDISEGLGEYLAMLEVFHKATGDSFAGYVDKKVTEKARRYNTIDNRDQAELDAEAKRDAKAYRKQSDGD